MRRALLSVLLAVLVAPLWVAAAPAAAGSEALRINGSTTVNPVVARAAEALRAEGGMVIRVDTQGGSSGGIAALGDGRAEVAMSSRPLNARDRAKYPDADFRPVPIGYDALALVVSRDIWEGGVRALSPVQLQGLYEGRIRNWREVGGPDRRVVFFNKEPGRGTWEVFASWLYGSADEAPLVSLPEVGSNEEARTKVASTRGAITQLSAAWADGETVFALGLRDGEGRVAEADAASLATGRYPLARPLLVITSGPADARAGRLIDFLLGPRGQKLVRASGYLGLDQFSRRVEGQPSDRGGEGGVGAAGAIGAARTRGAPRR